MALFDDAEYSFDGLLALLVEDLGIIGVHLGFHGDAPGGSDPPLRFGVATAITIAKRLNDLLRRKTAESLTHILDAAANTPLDNFATSLRRDVGAIQAALDLPWTTSPVEARSIG